MDVWGRSPRGGANQSCQTRLNSSSATEELVTRYRTDAFAPSIERPRSWPQSGDVRDETRTLKSNTGASLQSIKSASRKRPTRLDPPIARSRLVSTRPSQRARSLKQLRANARQPWQVSDLAEPTRSPLLFPQYAASEKASYSAIRYPYTTAVLSAPHAELPAAPPDASTPAARSMRCPAAITGLPS